MADGAGVLAAELALHPVVTTKPSISLHHVSVDQAVYVGGTPDCIQLTDASNQ